VVQSYELDDRVSIPSRGNGKILSLRHRVQAGSGPHSASYPVCKGDFLLRG
jgi:hypothetical protein